MPTRLLLGTLAFLILAGLGGTAYFYRAAVQHAARAASLDGELTRTRAEAIRERERADQLAAKSAELDTQLGNAKTRTTATESKNSQLAHELTATKSSLSERQSREIALLAEIESLRQRIKDATESAAPGAPPPSSATLTTSASGPVSTTLATSAPLAPAAAPPPSSAVIMHEPPASAGSSSNADVDTYRERITVLEAQLADLLARALAEPPAAPPPEPAVAAPSPYQVMRIGADDAFVIVDYGADQGAAPGDELALCRGTTVVARVQISDARARFSVAQVLPAALKRQLQTGDFVLIAK